MKRVFLFIFLICLVSCNDGDLEIETVDFDSIDTIQSCDDVSVSTSNVLFKINGDEALIVELPSGLLLNEVTTTDLESAVPGATTITYRIFSDDVTSDYFCSSIPEITPTVLEEIEAEAGTVFITTVAGEDDTFEHTIELSGISFVTENGNRITDLQISEFGTVTTSL